MISVGYEYIKIYEKGIGSLSFSSLPQKDQNHMPKLDNNLVIVCVYTSTYMKCGINGINSCKEMIILVVKRFLDSDINRH